MKFSPLLLFLLVNAVRAQEPGPLDLSIVFMRESPSDPENGASEACANSIVQALYQAARPVRYQLAYAIGNNKGLSYGITLRFEDERQSDARNGSSIGLDSAGELLAQAAQGPRLDVEEHRPGKPARDSDDVPNLSLLFNSGDRDGGVSILGSFEGGRRLRSNFADCSAAEAEILACLENPGSCPQSTSPHLAARGSFPRRPGAVLADHVFNLPNVELDPLDMLIFSTCEKFLYQIMRKHCLRRIKGKPKGKDCLNQSAIWIQANACCIRSSINDKDPGKNTNCVPDDWDGFCDYGNTECQKNRNGACCFCDGYATASWPCPNS